MLLGFLTYVFFALFSVILVVAVPQSLARRSNGLVGCGIVTMALVEGTVVIAVDAVVLLVMALYSLSFSLVLLFLLVVGVALFFGLLVEYILSLAVVISRSLNGFLGCWYMSFD